MSSDFHRDILQEFLKRLESEDVPKDISGTLKNILDKEEAITCENLIQLIQECTPRINKD
jgi:hypothetical protein